MIPPVSWLVHLAGCWVCLASVHVTQATSAPRRHAHLGCGSYFYFPETLAQTHTQTSNRLDPAAKHSTPTSERFERGATRPTPVLGSLYGHHHRAGCHSEADPDDLLSNTQEEDVDCREMCCWCENKGESASLMSYLWQAESDSCFL